MSALDRATGRIGHARSMRPVGTARPVLLLPDRSGFLQRVDAEPGGRERLVAMRRRHRDRDRRLRQLELADPVQQRDPLEHRASGAAPRPRSRPSRGGPAPRRPRRSSRARPRVPRRDRARRRRTSRRRRPGRRGPRGQRVDGQRVVGQRHPIATVVRGREHGEQSTEGVPKPAGAAEVPARSRAHRSRSDGTASLHSIAMGYAGDEHDDESLGEIPDDEGHDHPRERASRPARSALAASERAFAAHRSVALRRPPRSHRCGPRHSWRAPPGRS